MDLYWISDFWFVQVVGLGALWHISSSALHTLWALRLRVARPIGPSSSHCVARFLCLANSPTTVIVQVLVLSSFAFCRIRLSSCLSDICNFGGWLKRILNILLGFLSMLRQGSRSLGAGHPSHIRWSRKFMLVWCCSSCCILVQMLQALTARLWWYRMLGYRGCRLVIDLAWSCCVCFRATQERYGDNWMYSFRKDIAKSRKQWLVSQNLKKGDSSDF